MNVVNPRCCGLDIHKKTVMACVKIHGEKKNSKFAREFGTMTDELLALSDWLEEHGVRQVAMESTGVFWKPIYNLLEGRFEIILVNAHHIKQVPGRKTDVKDCEWIAELLQHGLLKASFIPPKPIREIRDLTRHRAQVTGDRTRIANRIHKVLEDANIKLGSVASDVLGVSGRQMIEGIIKGEDDPEILAEMARRQLRGKIPELKRALKGRVTSHHRFMLETLYGQLKDIEKVIKRLGDRIQEVMELDDAQRKETSPSETGGDVIPFSEAVELLTTIPGIRTLAAETILAEIGTRMSQFPSANHLASWVGVSSGNNESAGKRKSGRTTKGNRWLRRILVQVALVASRTKNTYLSSQFRRIAARRGGKRAAVAVAHTILVTIYHMLRNRKPYKDLGADYFNSLDPKRLTRYFVKRLESLGLKVTIEPTKVVA